MSRIQELKRNLSLALQESSWDDALAVLEKLVSVEESQPAYHNQIGDILLKSGRQAEAIGSFMRGIHAYRELGMYGNGAALCKKVLRLEPEQREAIWVLGELKTRQGFLADGAEKMLEGLRLFAEDPGFARKSLLELLEQAESLQASSQPLLEFVAATYGRLEERERARRATLRLADLEEAEGRREQAERLRTLAREYETPTEGATAPPATTAEANADPAVAAANVAPPPPAAQLEPITRPIVPRAKAEDIERLMITQPGEAPAPPSAAPAPAARADEGFEAITVSHPPAPDPPAESRSEPELEAAATPSPAAGAPGDGDRPDAELDAEAEALAASMLAQLQGDLPDVEVLSGRSDLEEPFSTRQGAKDLSSQLHAEASVGVLKEREQTAPSRQPSAERAGRQENAASATAQPPEGVRTPGRPAAHDEPALELASLHESLREAEGDWERQARKVADLKRPGPRSAAPQPDEERPERRHRSVDLDRRPGEGHLSFGLSTTAGEALQTDDIDEVLGEFKRRMKEQMGSMAAEERYQLGVSYMEMGLYEEALEEFEHTLEHKVLGQKTREWMARCLLELERPREIVLLLQTRLDAETYPRKSMVELYYMLGQAYEMLKAWDLALDAFTKVYQLDSEFRDVQAKLAKLTDA